jgi:hypothetical protein
LHQAEGFDPNAPQDGRLAPPDGLDRSDAFFRSTPSRARVWYNQKKAPQVSDLSGLFSPTCPRQKRHGRREGLGEIDAMA